MSPSITQPEPVRENELGDASVKFSARGALTWREIKANSEVVFALGDISILTVIFIATLLVMLAAISVFWGNGLHRGIALGSVIVGSSVFAGYLCWMKSRPGPKLHLRKGACSIVFQGRTFHLASVDTVLVMNSQFYRDGGESIDGVSELFLKYAEEGSFSYFPVAATSGKNGTMHLAKRIARILEVPISTKTR